MNEGRYTERQEVRKMDQERKKERENDIKK